MKTNKEYPATHSMSTAWFAADEEGNVGIFDFNENGPVPQNIFDTSANDILTDEFLDKSSGYIGTYKITDEQAEEFFDKDAVSENDAFCFLKIRKGNVSDFENKVKAYNDNSIICLSKNKGFYMAVYHQNYKELYGAYIEEKYCTDFFVSDSFDEANKEVVFEYDFTKNPFYIYAQPYWISHPIKRLIKPRFPIGITQLPQSIQRLIVKLPVKFSETEYMQIAQYVPAKVYDAKYKKVSIEVFPGQKFSFDYYQLGAEKGISYFLTDSIIHTSAKAYNECQSSYYPTLLFICEPFNDDKARNFCLYKYINNYVCLPFIEYVDDYYTSNKSSKYMLMKNEDKIKNFSKSYIENNIRFFNPYLILIKDEIKFVLEHYYKLENHQITINNQTFPYFLFSEMEQHRDEILEYSNKEYRGIKIPTKLTKSEIKKYQTQK
ncbi:MAG: hypothetical protein II852_14025 [Bacteroidales bacterium]|nr:hypothetical protein [Bacteroidales bacterium]